jgi:membrane protease YdiL (CAAX protease family)
MGTTPRGDDFASILPKPCCQHFGSRFFPNRLILGPKMLWTPNNLAIAGTYALAILIVYIASLCRLMGFQKQDQQPPPLPGNPAKPDFNKGDLFAAGGLVLFYLLSSIHPQSEKPLLERLTSYGVIINAVIQFAIVFGIVGFAARRTNVREWLGIPPRCDWRFFLLGPITVVSIWMLMVVLQLTGLIGFLSKVLRVDQTQDIVQVFTKSQDGLLLTLLSLTAVVVAPVCEEIMFRGYLFRVMERYAGTTPAIVASSLVFACAHGNAVIMLPLFILALVLCRTYSASRSILPSMSIHLIFNLTTVVFQLVARFADLKIDKLP